MPAACPSLPSAARAPADRAETDRACPAPRPGHPAGLYTLGLAVLCERWAACTLGASGVLMLCERYGYARGDALRLWGLFNAATYLATVPGGFAVDHALGARRGLGAGMALLGLGYAALTLPGSAAPRLALVLLLLGHALLKPSTQAVLGRLYAPGETRLAVAQIVLYVAVNAGGTAGAVAAGLLLRGHDFRVPCAVAAAVTLAGRVVLALRKGTLRLRPRGQPVPAEGASEPGALSGGQRAKVIGGLTLAMLLYTVGFGQVEGSLFLWAQDRTDRVLLGFEVPAPWFVGLPAFLVLILAPVQLALLPRVQRCVSTQRLVAWGLFAVVLGFAVLIPPALWSTGPRVSMAWLVACMTLLVVGELLVAPLGLSMLLRLAPPRSVCVVVGVWYVAGALGFWLAGEVGAARERQSIGRERRGET